MLRIELIFSQLKFVNANAVEDRDRQTAISRDVEKLESANTRAEGGPELT